MQDESDFKRCVDDALAGLAIEYGTAPMRQSEIVMAMQGWNKMLAFRTSFSEALVLKWRHLVHPDACSKSSKKVWLAMGQVERNEDILANCFGPRLADLEDLLIGFLDGVIRSFCPKEQRVAREAYRPVHDDVVLDRKEGELTLECESLEDYVRLFARCGVKPQYWIFFCRAFLWCMKTHVPYAQDDDAEDLEKGRDGAYAKAVRNAAIKAIDGYYNLKSQMRDPVFSVGVTRYWDRLDRPTRVSFGETFYRTLLEKHPQLLDFFSKTDMDSLALHFLATLDLLVKSIGEMGDTGNFRKALDMLGEVHRQRRIPTYSYPMVGGQLLETLNPSMVNEEEITKNDSYPVTAKQLSRAFAVLYTEVMSIVYYPMLLEEKLIAKAHDFYEKIQVELSWNDHQLKRRMLKIEQEISASGTYSQTAQEIELGARIAWRNSAKCIGRISWNTLQIRDSRNITDPISICEDLNEHLRIATAGTNIQSVMTVFKPLGSKETLGTRFWSSQIVRYAGYQNLDGSVTGDPANVTLTRYLLENDLWEPPQPVTPFDVLPLVLKVPGRELPYIYKIPPEYVFEVNIEHPTRPEVAGLGYKWTTVPAITNFKMNLGGVVYANMPFNGWFLSTEIVRNLMERYDAGPPMAELLGLDIKTNPMWKQLAFCEFELAVLYSFKKNGFTIVDPTNVGKSFCTHVRREREDFGRECPGQWSWIGGLAGTTNDTWHLEMRDFLLYPQYDYCMDGVTFYNDLATLCANDGYMTDEVSTADETASTGMMSNEGDFMREETGRVKVLIAYGSETGSAEAAARRLKRELTLLKPDLMCLNDLAREMGSMKKRNFSHVIFLCSTFGKGNPPSNAEAFFEMELPQNALSNTKFAVLALGSSLYPDFCKAGMTLEKKIASSGSTKLIPVQKVDDAAGAEGDIVEWIGLVKRMVMPPHIEEAILAARSATSAAPPVNVIEWTGKSAPEPDYPGCTGALCISNNELVTNLQAGSRSIKKITFKLQEGASYETGDHLCVYPINRPGMVTRFLKCFEAELSAAAKLQKEFPQSATSSDDEAVKWLSEQLFEITCIENGSGDPADVFFETPICLRDLLHHQVDLSLSSRNAVEFLKVFQREADAFAAKLEPDILNEYLAMRIVKKFYAFASSILEEDATKTTDAVDAYVAQYPSVVEFLEDFHALFLTEFGKHELGLNDSTTIMPLAEVLVILPRLQPRYYSISSSSKTGKPSEVSITVGVLEATTSKGVVIEGVCSHYLAELKAGTDRARISVVKSNFRLPADDGAPIMMVGTGTGLSPLMGFLEDKAAVWKAKEGNFGPIHLFFGCRTEADFIYRDLIEDYDKSKMIELHLALSRSVNAPKKYVQHKIAEMGKRACDLLQHSNTHYYVCGDARMADECFEACVEILRTHAVISRVGAVQHLRQMQLEGRWQTDVWGIISHFEDSKKAMESEKKMRAKMWLARLAQDHDGV